MKLPSSRRSTRLVDSRQRGYSLLEMGLVVGAIALFAVIGFVAYTDTQSTANQTQAMSEINGLSSSARQFRSAFAQGGLYTNLTNVKELVDNGYSVGGMSLNGNDGVNAYGLAVTIASAAAGADANIVYTTPSEEDCLALMGNFTDNPGTTATTATDEHVAGYKAGCVCSSAGALTLVME